MAKHIIIGCITLGILVFAQSAIGAQYDYEIASSYRDSGFREAVEMDDWLERGRAAVTESPVFPDGIRLTAWGGANAYEPGLASAIYYFKVPRWAQYLKITIQYRDATRDDAIAGRLWIKSTDRDQYEALGAGEESPLYGDTFVLRSDRTSETIIVARNRHVEDDMVEMHVVAGGQDCLDIRDVRLISLETRPRNLTIVRRTYNDYWDRWPRHQYAYHYYYWGPLYWPKTYVVYECWDIPTPFYWITWRPWFFVNIIRVHHHHPWWGPRRYTVIYHVDVKQPLIKRRPVLRTRLREHQVQVTRIIRPTPKVRTAVPPPVRTSPTRQQEVRLKTDVQTSRTLETTVNKKPTKRPVKEQPVRKDQGHAKPRVDTQPKTVKRPQAVNNPSDALSTPPTPKPQRIQKPPAQPRTAKQPSRSMPRAPEATAQVPDRKQVDKPDAKVKSAPTHRLNPEQVAGDKKRPERAAKNQGVEKPKRPQVVNKSDARSARPSPNASQRIRNNQAQQQPRSRSMDREAGREPTKIQTAQDQKAQLEGTVQKQTKIGQGNRPQSRQERPEAGKRRPR
jgi:hypothetical protein